MKQCDTCGGPLPEGHPFALCPKCIFGGVIGLPAGPSSGGEPSGLPVALDFFDKYDLLEKIAGGGQGEIWKVWDLEFHRYVAMKRIAGAPAKGSAAIHRFLAEAQIASQLEHPGVLPIFDLGFDPDGRAFYTTQLLPGTTLEDVWRRVGDVKDADWTIPRALALLLRVCEVMGYAHSRGVIHCDLKPANILVGAFGEVRVADWGSAHLMESARNNFEDALASRGFPAIETDRSRELQDHPDSPLATASSGRPVTLFFSPPEVVAGGLNALGPATDIYALGVMLYQLLTGKIPYGGASEKKLESAEVKRLILQGPPASVRSLNPRGSRDLAAICEKAMARDLAMRYATMAELGEDLQSALEFRPVRARRPGIWLTLQKWSQRNFSYVLLAGGALLLLVLVLASALGFKAQRDVARQASLIRNAELAARAGHWRESLQDWDEAAAAGYRDSIDLDLQRAEAWTVLDEPDRAGALLAGLAARPDLGRRRGVVLLRFGEHLLFEGRQPARAVQLVRDAMAAGLTDADRLFAKGLLADSTPEALALFHRAIQYDGYHHGAHRHSLSLEFLLGHHQELANHIEVFRVLYPDDPSPVLIAAAEAAMAGDLTAAQSDLAAAQKGASSNHLAQAGQACRVYATAAKFYDVDSLLEAQQPRRTPLDQLRADPFSAGILLMPGDFRGLTNRQAIRVPRLPCIQQGMLAAGDGLSRLIVPYLANPVIAVQEIETGWRHHPEGLLPTLGGMMLENQQPRDGPPAVEIKQWQARLYQMGASSPSMMPQIRRLARYLAARTEFELATGLATNSRPEISNCLANVRAAAADPETSAAECQAYFQLALKLQDNDLAWQLANRLEQRQPGGESAQRDRITVELALGAFPMALDEIEKLLARHPGDPWALEQRQAVMARLKLFLDSLNHPARQPLQP